MAMLLTTALPLAITSGIIWYQVNQQIEKDRSYADNRIKQDLKGQIDQFALSLNETAYQIYSNPDLIESIARNKQFLTDSRTYDTRRDIQEFFLSVYNQSRFKNIMGMYLFRLDEESSLGNFFPHRFPRMNADYFRSLQSEVENNNHKPLIKVRTQSVYDEPIVQFLYPVRYRGNPTGLLVIDIQEQSFRGLVESYNTFYQGQVILTDANGDTIYATNSDSVGDKFAADELKKRTVAIQTPLEHSSMTLNYLYDIGPEQIFYRNLAIMMIAAAGLLALLFSIWLSYSITKPIIQMHRKMARIQIGDYDARVEVRTSDEIGYLGMQFNRMAETIQQLIEHDLKLRFMNQETQIKALQAQISPHFLFNTLQMMAGIAEMNKVPDLKLICQSLGNMYRYNMNIQNEWVSLRDEIMHIRNYLVIINKRFPESIRFRLDIEPGAYDMYIPKLILQPIVENAVEHGLIPNHRNRKLLKISARMRRDDDCMYLYVLDNGIGLSEFETRAIEKLLRNGHLTEGEEESPIGLYNVHSRISLICGEGYGIKLRSRKGRGTCIVYRLPLKGGAEK
ncbi:sensor histidine kinase [Cohnella mopanensis]|uniref:sensor histidine kinase n=1 Tax=Cohnella mopanensis TaxID=2911966 RepID=UPI001EF77815|nr:sensor histidine kinase [Cohnella mopanensis]